MISTNTSNSSTPNPTINCKDRVNYFVKEFKSSTGTDKTEGCSQILSDFFSQYTKTFANEHYNNDEDNVPSNYCEKELESSVENDQDSINTEKLKNCGDLFKYLGNSTAIQNEICNVVAKNTNRAFAHIPPNNNCTETNVQVDKYFYQEARKENADCSHALNEEKKNKSSAIGKYTKCKTSDASLLQLFGRATLRIGTVVMVIITALRLADQQ